MNYKHLLFLLISILTIDLSAQVDLSKFSNSMRSKMAEEEQLASEEDPVFQDLMTLGVDRFEDQEYEEAIASFEQAGDRRPINVYPPVMIEDVKLAMANHVEPETPEPEIEEVPEEAKEPELTAEERVEQMYQQELAKVYDKMPPKPKEKEPEAIEEPEVRDPEGLIILEKEIVDTPEEVSVESKSESIVETESVPKEIEPAEEEKDIIKKTTVVKAPDVEDRPAPKTTRELQEELAKEFPDGVTEDVYQEGNRTITKRVVVKDGLGDEYRKVKHGWGGVFFFKNGVSISERVWIQESSLK